MLESIIGIRQAKFQVMGGLGYAEEILGMKDDPTKQPDTAMTFLTAGHRNWLQDLNPSLYIP